MRLVIISDLRRRTKMKKKLSLLLALVFVLTLAFSILPCAGAVTEPAAAGDVQLLSQASDISVLTLFEFLGLAMISAGVSSFILLRKKHQEKDYI